MSLVGCIAKKHLYKLRLTTLERLFINKHLIRFSTQAFTLGTIELSCLHFSQIKCFYKNLA